MSLTAKRKREMQAAGVKFGCWVNAQNEEEPIPDASCVIDTVDQWGCISFDRERYRTREACPYWREVVEIKDETK